MTQAELFEVAGYFANPIRNTRIEIEAKQRTLANYSPAYLAQTGQPLLIPSDAVTSLSNEANKWGREMRLYFSHPNTSALPTSIINLVTVGGRPGYDQWSDRLNSKDIIDELFDYGFLIGHPQNEIVIRARIPSAYLSDFNRGYSIP